MLARMNSLDPTVLRRRLFAQAAALNEQPWQRALSESGARAWLVGGAVRDLALGLDPLDIDLAVEGDALALGRLLAEKLSGRFIALHEQFGSCRIVLPDKLQLDLTALQGATIEQDLTRRDLTINAMALPLPTGDTLLDPFDGLADLINGVARCPGPEVIGDDPVRALRVFRFAAEFDLQPTPETLDQVAAQAAQLKLMPGERVWEELRRLLAGEAVANWIEALDRTGVLDGLFPELAAAADVEQPSFHHLDVRGHSVLCAMNLDHLLDDELLAPALARPHDRCLLRLACLLHDLGKPQTATEKDERLRFPGHPQQGAAIADKICRRLRLSNNDRRRVTTLVDTHMRPHQLAELLAIGRLSAKATRNFLVDLAADWRHCLTLARADLLATAGPAAPPDGEEKAIRLTQHLNEAMRKRMPAPGSPPLVTGADVLALGVEPGSHVGRLLELVEQARFENPDLTREEALALIEASAAEEK